MFLEIRHAAEKIVDEGGRFIFPPAARDAWYGHQLPGQLEYPVGIEMISHGGSSKTMGTVHPALRTGAMFLLRGDGAWRKLSTHNAPNPLERIISMSFLKASSSFTRFRIIDEIPQETWESIPSKLRQFSFRDIDDIAEERSFGWTNFDDMLDTAWSVSPPEKADYLAFTLRLDTRRIPPAVMRKHVQLALRDELKRIKESGKNFIPRERKKELAEQVKLRLMGRFLPIPAEFQVIWNTVQGTVWLGSTQGKIIDMFLELFTRSFNIRLEQMLPYNLALAMLGNGFSEKLDALEATQFFA
jgi:hypothetical protein